MPCRLRSPPHPLSAGSCRRSRRPGGSVRFPEGNWTSDRAGRGLLLQPGQGIALAGSGRPQAIFALLRLPLDKRDGRLTKGIMGHAGKGGNRFRLGLGNPDISSPNSATVSPPIRWAAGAAPWRWQALSGMRMRPLSSSGMTGQAHGRSTGIPRTGDRHPGPPLTETGVTDSGQIAPFNIGGWGSLTAFGEPANPGRDPLWTGRSAPPVSSRVRSLPRRTGRASPAARRSGQYCPRQTSPSCGNSMEHPPASPRSGRGHSAHRQCGNRRRPRRANSRLDTPPPVGDAIRHP